MHSYNFGSPNPTNKFIFILPHNLSARMDVTDKYFVEPFLEKGGKIDDLTLLYLTASNTTNAAYYEKQISLITKLLKVTKSPYLYIADATIFTKLTKTKRASNYYGLPMQCKLEESPDTLCFMGVNPTQALISDTYAQALNNSVERFTDCLVEKVEAFKPQIITSSELIFETEHAIRKLQEYFELPYIAVDIETKSLRPNETGIETIAFAKSPNEGFAIAVDRNHPIRAKNINKVLKAFFQKYKGTYIWHGGKFDRKIITNCYFSFDDNPMLSSKQHEDTMLMAYCCLNSVERPGYGLKDLSFEFAGDYGIDVKNTTAIELNTLLDYNLFDACNTFWLFNKFSRKLVIEDQYDIYKEIFLPSLNTLIKTELHGIPVSPEETKKFIAEINLDHQTNLDKLLNLNVITELTQKLREDHCAKRNEKLKTKTILVTDPECLDIKFNPGSPQQLSTLLYDVLKLPIFSYTKKGAASTSGDTLEKLLAHTKPNTDAREVVESLIELSKCKMIIATFIPILEEAITKNLKSGIGYIYGNFNIPGTISGRLSSSEPNLQNMPSTGTKYAKAFKRCLIAPPGFVLVGVDFDSLEDKISAKTTQDPNKLKVYLEGFDGHSLRAYYYYPDKIPRMEVTPENINKIADTHPELRQDSKPITFALTYLGMYKTLMENCGLSETEAKRIEANYHELYKVSDEYVDQRLQQAAKEGFVRGAFGFKLRAEILKRVVINDRKTPFKIQEYLRTLGNMLGQSYGLLNSRAANEVFDECYKAGIHNDVFPIAQIHDAQYFVVRDNKNTIAKLCDILKKAVSWDDLPELKQDPVPLSGTPQLSFTNWADLDDINYNNYVEFLDEYDRIKAQAS